MRHGKVIRGWLGVAIRDLKPEGAEQTAEVAITSDQDIITVRKAARDLAKEVGFGVTDVTRIITAASELARNINSYAGSGVMRCRRLSKGGQAGVELEFLDEGPGIADLDSAMQPGVSSGRGLGLGLAGTRRLMDEMEVSPREGGGTRIVVRKWRIS